MPNSNSCVQVAVVIQNEVVDLAGNVVPTLSLLNRIVGPIGIGEVQPQDHRPCLPLPLLLSHSPCILQAARCFRDISFLYRHIEDANAFGFSSPWESKCPQQISSGKKA